MQSIKKQFKHFAVIIAMIMAMTSVLAATAPSYATLHSVPAATQIDELSSSKYFKEEYFKVRTPLKENNVIYVEGKTKEPAKLFCIRLTKHKGNSVITAFVKPNNNGEFSIKINTTKGNKTVPEVIDNKGTVIQANESYGTTPGYNAVGTIDSGYYHLTVTKATSTADANVSPGTQWWNGSLGGTKGYAWKDAVLWVKSGQNNNPKVVKYQSAINNNNSIRNMYEPNATTDSSFKGSYVRYQDTYLRDMDVLLLTNPKTRKVTQLTANNVQYIKNISKKVTQGASTNYGKALKIYEYVASNVYYDNYAFAAGKYQYANPYENLYNLNSKKTSANSVNGKVATTCQGFAGMVIAMARAEGIPARIVYGHHVSQGISIWTDETASSVAKLDHWWAELWIDGRWVIVDANAATKNNWERKNFSDKGKWNKYDQINYVAFDPSLEQMSSSYAYNDIYRGSTAGKYICNKNEISQLKAFLNTKSSGKTNGKRLNSKYSATNFATWGTSAADNFVTNGYGRVTHILWGNKGLTGSMNLSNFTKLKYLTVYNNKISSLKLTGCSSLEKISATYTKISTFDSSASNKTTSITAKGNNLTSAKFKHKGAVKSITRNNSGGTFSFDYNKSKSKSLTIYVNSPAKGYKYLGIYNSSGKKLSSSTTYTFNPTSSKYVVKFAKK